MQFDKVTVRVSEMQTQVVVCAPWETPILQAIYGEDSAVVTGSEEVDRAPPDPQDEFTRLAVRYGPKNADTPVVAAVYGSFGPGFQALGRAIAEVAFVDKGEPELEVPELTPEQVEQIQAKYVDKQPELIEAIEPQPPIEKIDEGASDPTAVDGTDEAADDPLAGGEDEGYEE